LPGRAPLPAVRRPAVRWFHQSWAVIGGLLVIAGFFVFSFASPLFLVIYELALVGYGLWLFFGTMDRTLTSDRPAILEMHAWLASRSAPSVPQLPDHQSDEGFFLYLRSDPPSGPELGATGLDQALADALEPWGPLMLPRDPTDRAAVLDLARRARLVFWIGGPTTAAPVPLREDPALWTKTVLVVPPSRDDAMTALRRLDVNLPLADDVSDGLLAAARPDAVPLDPFPILDAERSRLAESLVRARPDLVHGPCAAPGAVVVIDTHRALRTDDGAAVSKLWLQPSEARLGTVRELVVDGRSAQVRVPEGTTAEHQLRIPSQVPRPGGGPWGDLVLDVEVT